MESQGYSKRMWDILEVESLLVPEHGAATCKESVVSTALGLIYI